MPSTFQNPALRLSSGVSQTGFSHWQSPSNIAIVKYWGKFGIQEPRNPSISFTLSSAYTDMDFHYMPRENQSEGIALDFRFEGQSNLAFAQKIQRFLESLVRDEVFPFLSQFQFKIESYNSFPHSAGIASSASSMSALALCLCSMERDLFGTLADENEFLQKASYVARLGSGSACRSVYPLMAWWGAGSLGGSTNQYARPCGDWIHPVFHTYHDDILIVSKGEKKVSSRAGHGLMEGNPYAEARYQQAHTHMDQLTKVLKNGDVETFGQIAELEALTLHALMMSSKPPYVLMQPNSLALISKVRSFREESGLPLYFTLDAGPNLHLLYPDESAVRIKAYIQAELLPFCEEGKVIEDQVGNGPIRLG
jgi:diphosphomevalonate decarboxylase